MRSLRLVAVPAALLSLTALSACSGGSAKTAPTPSTTASPTSPTASATASPTAAAATTVDLLTGLSPRRSAPVVAIKVDNSVLARPYQRGLRSAAVVYQELVEGGSTRLLAVLESDAAADVEVGPIRSVRESDIDLLREYGGIAVGFSGGNTGVKATFASGARNGYVVDASYDAVPSAYRLGERRRDARNFFTTAGKLAARRPGAVPRDIGLRFGPLPAGAVPVVSATAAFSGMSAVRFRPLGASWVLTQGGSVLPVSPANVIVQYVQIHRSRYKDVNGNPTPFTVSTGAGRAVVFRDGRKITGTWSRSGYGATHFLAGGRDVALKPGPTWVFLLPTTGSLSTS